MVSLPTASATLAAQALLPVPASVHERAGVCPDQGLQTTHTGSPGPLTPGEPLEFSFDLLVPENQARIPGLPGTYGQQGLDLVAVLILIWLYVCEFSGGLAES